MSYDAFVDYEDRPRHVYMPGATQNGKSTLIHWHAIQDIAKGHGVCVIDGKGDLFQDRIIHWLPEDLIEHTIYLDPDTPVPLDFMNCAGDREKEKLVSELKYILTRGVDISHAYSVEANLENIIYTLLNYNDNPNIEPKDKATFLDIYWFLKSERRRKQILAGVTDDNLKAEWTHPLSGADQARITGRMNKFVRSPTLIKIFDAPEPKLNIAQAIEEKKILLIKVGPPGDDVTQIYASLILAKIRQAFYRYIDTPKRNRAPFFLYCDEFQEYKTSDFDKMLSLAGGLGLCLTLSHQYEGQIRDVLPAVKGNVQSYFVFRVGEETANTLRSQFPETILYHGDLWKTDKLMQNLMPGEAIYKSAKGATTVIDTPAPPERPAISYAERIKTRTVEKYRCETVNRSYDEGDASQSEPDREGGGVEKTKGVAKVKDPKGGSKNSR